MKEHIVRWSYLSINLFGKIFLQGFSCYAPLNWQQLPCFTQQLNGHQRQSIWSFWETKDKIINPSRSPGCGELKPPSLCCPWEHAHLDFSCIVSSRLIFLFSWLWRGEGGEREIFMNTVLYLLSFLCLCFCSLVFESAQLLYWCAACRMGASWPHSSGLSACEYKLRRKDGV